jgi:uncharacterized protein YjcR
MRVRNEDRRAEQPGPVTGLPPSHQAHQEADYGSAPKGNQNALKHGACSAESLALKREAQGLARMARETMAAIE